MAKKTNWNQGTQAGASSGLVVTTDDRTIGSRSSAQGATVRVSDNTGKDVGTVKVVGSQGVLASKGGRKPEHGF
jgi:hypothetical protein